MGRGRLWNIWAFGCTYGRKYIYIDRYIQHSKVQSIQHPLPTELFHSLSASPPLTYTLSHIHTLPTPSPSQTDT